MSRLCQPVGVHANAQPAMPCVMPAMPFGPVTEPGTSLSFVPPPVCEEEVVCSNRKEGK